MSLWRKLRHLVPSIRRAEEQDLRDELQALKELAAPGELGNLTVAAEDARRVFGWGLLEHLGQDLRYGVRALWHEKTFALLAVASLTLSIGASTSIYSFMDSVLLRPLPVPEASALAEITWHADRYTIASTGFAISRNSSRDSSQGLLAAVFPYPALATFQASTDVVAGALCYADEEDLGVMVNHDAQPAFGQYVSGSYFPTLQVTPFAGRLLQATDDAPGGSPVAVVSYGFSERRFGSPRAAVGQSIRINDKPFQVVGVTPAAFFGVEPGEIPDVYVPLHAIASAASLEDEHYYWLGMMARLKPGVTLTRAQAALAPRFRSFAESTASAAAKRDLPDLRLLDGAEGFGGLRRQFAAPIYVLSAVVGLILLIACSNIANLLLARGAARRREIAIRLAIGASRSRVVRQLLTESVLLSIIGGALGVVVAWWSIRVLTVLLSNGDNNFTLHAELDWRELAIAAMLSVATGLFFGLAPALQATRVDLAPALKEGRTDQATRLSRRIGLGPALVVTQIAFSLVLLVAAGLFGRTLANLDAIEPGFNRDHVLLFTIRPTAVGYQGPATDRLFEDVRHAIGRVPGVQSVSLSAAPLPMGGGTLMNLTILGAPAPEGTVAGRPANLAVIASVGPGFFQTMRFHLTAGRDFTAADNAGAAKVAIVNHRFARAFGLDNPVGRTLVSPDGQFEIVGIVDDALAFNLKEDRLPGAYFPYLQATRPVGQMTYEVRTAGNPLDFAKPATEVVRGIDSRLPMQSMETEAAHIDHQISQEITLARLCSLFAGLALVIACVGLYGTVAFNVARRTSEIGIRMALGASGARIMSMILRDVLGMTGLGLVIGLPLVFAGARYVTSFMFGIVPTDPIAIAGAVTVLLASGLLATLVPARRASRVDPMRAVRVE